MTRRCHRDTLRRIEAESMQRDLDRQRRAWEYGRNLRDVLGASEVLRDLLDQIHTAEAEAAQRQGAETLPWVRHLHRNEVAGLEGRDPIIEFREVRL